MQYHDSLNTSSITTHVQPQYSKPEALGGATNSSINASYSMPYDEHNSTMNTVRDAYRRLAEWNSDAPMEIRRSDDTTLSYEDEKKRNESEFSTSKEATNPQTITTRTNSSLSSTKGKFSSTPFPSAVHTSSTAGNAEQRGIQREGILSHVNELLRFCQLKQSEGVTSIRQCTSSLFVLLYQRLFGCAIANIDSSPNTLEKKRRNVALVLEELRKRSYTLGDISVEQVVRLNEEHISRLIMIFVSIADEMKYQQERMAVAEQTLQRPPASHADADYIVAEVAPRDAGGAASRSNLYPREPTTGGVDTGRGLSGHAGAVSSAFAEAAPDSAGAHEGVRYAEQAAYLPPSASSGSGMQSYAPPYAPTQEVADNNAAAEKGAGYGLPEEEEEGEGEGEVVSSSYEEFASSKADALPYVAALPLPKEKFMEIWSRGIVSPGVGLADSPSNAYFPNHPNGGKLLSSPTTTPLRLGSSDIRHRFRRLSEAIQDPALRRRTPGNTMLFTPNSTVVGQQSAETPRTPHGHGHAHATEKPPPSQAKAKKIPQPVSLATTAKSTPVHARSTKKRALSRWPRPQPQPRPRGLFSSLHPLRSSSTRPPTIELSSPALDETPLTDAETRLLASHPYSLFCSEERDRKIERLRACRFLNEMQNRLHQGLRREYESRMAETRQSLKRQLDTSKRNMLDGMRWIRDENNKYRDAYAVLMEAATNDSSIAQHMMSSHTARLAKHYSESLQETQRISAYLEREREQMDMMNLVRYAQRVTSWQKQLAV